MARGPLSQPASWANREGTRKNLPGLFVRGVECENGRVRGLGQDMTIGQRVAWYRARRGLTQEVLAGMVGRTTDWLGKVENGRANLERLSVIKSLADALDITVGDLLGEPSVMDWVPDASTRTVTLLREALMSYPALTPTPAEGDAPSIEELRGQVEQVWSAYQASRFAYATTQLPKVIAGAKAAARHGDTGESRRDAQRVLALAYHAASATLTKVGEADLAWIAADRGLTCAEESEDPMVLGSLLRSVAHALLANGRYDDAASVVSRAADRLDVAALPDSALRWSLVGSLYLVGAMASARADNAREARAFLARAREAGQRARARRQPRLDGVRPDQRRRPRLVRRDGAGRPAGRLGPRPDDRRQRAARRAPRPPRPRSRQGLHHDRPG
jgi:transcriptional regulator with XRE-family HTH domain